MTALCQGAETAWIALGEIDYGRKSSEQGNVKFRRSLYFVNDVAEGEQVRLQDVRSIRPGYGLPPKFLSDVVGRKTVKRAKRGQPVSFDFFEQ
jgi:N-acetylneuraminate synthase